MEKPSCTLSHSISRLLGHTGDANQNRMECSSRIASDCTKEERASYQEEPPRTSADAVQCQVNSPKETHQELCIYPWMQFHRKPSQPKRRKSKRNFDCIGVKFQQ